MIESGKTPQSFLFYGNQGLGKTSFARAFAQALVGSKKESHPDIRMYALEESQTSHSIASIRELKEETYLPPFESHYKVLIVEDAHKMLAPSANALLKTLEEPASYCKIILLAENLSDLLPTIISRCCKVSFAPLSDVEIINFLVEQHQLELDEAALIAGRSQGSIGRALSFLNKEERAWQDVLCQVVLNFNIESVDQIQEKLNYLEEQIDKRATCSKESLYEYLLRLIRDLVVLKASLQSSFLFFKDQEQLLRSAVERITLSTDAIQKLWQEGYASLSCHVKFKVGLERFLIKLYGEI